MSRLTSKPNLRKCPLGERFSYQRATWTHEARIHRDRRKVNRNEMQSRGGGEESNTVIYLFVGNGAYLKKSDFFPFSKQSYRACGLSVNSTFSTCLLKRASAEMNLNLWLVYTQGVLSGSLSLSRALTPVSVRVHIISQAVQLSQPLLPKPLGRVRRGGTHQCVTPGGDSHQQAHHTTAPFTPPFLSILSLLRKQHSTICTVLPHSIINYAARSKNLLQFLISSMIM